GDVRQVEYGHGTDSSYKFGQRRNGCHERHADPRAAQSGPLRDHVAVPGQTRTGEHNRTHASQKLQPSSHRDSSFPGCGPECPCGKRRARIRIRTHLMQFLQESLIELITQTSTNLPPDVRQAVGGAIAQESPGTQASQALGIIATNIDMAADAEGPICQDTGMPTFDVHTPVGVNQIAIKKAIRAAVAEATK